MEHFRPHRYPTETPVSVKTPAGKMKAKVVDINDGGMRLSLPQDIAVGERISIDILGYPVKGVVRWAGRGFAGVVFRPKISTRHVDALRQGVNTGMSNHQRFHSYREMR